MEVKLFGKSLFSAKGNRIIKLAESSNNEEQSKYLPDFYNEGSGLYKDNELSEYISFIPVDKKSKKKSEPKTPTLTPKGVYELNLLHDEEDLIHILLLGLRLEYMN